MDHTILATKLYIPPPASNLVLRPRLMARLNEGFGRKLTLISAPAGFGKTTLISEWLAQAAGPAQPRAAWLSLDAGDNDLARFLLYLVAALRTVMPRPPAGEPEFGAPVVDALQSAQPPPVEPLLTALINAVAAVPGDFILVLDDYHAIENRVIDEAVAFLIEHLPPPLRLVITTREDPQLPLARLRARGQLTELRAGDLRFTPAEAAGFLQTMRLNLSAADLGVLEDRTEGWIAGLQLAALAMQSLVPPPSAAEPAAPSAEAGQADISGFISAFAGDHRYIMDYLVEEVLQRQAGPVRAFLLQTAVLDRLNGSLCDAVTGQPGGQAHLEALERGNFFVIPLDDQRRWYRYHHLFADVLCTHLHAEQPEQVAGLHRRASAWYAQHGALADAIRHALAAEDFAQAADWLEAVFPAMSRSRQETTLLGWLKALPAALIRGRPVLANLYAGALLQSGEIQAVEPWLAVAEGWLAPPPAAPPEPMVVIDQTEFRRLPGAVAIHRAGLALMLGQVDETIRCARRALELAPADDYLRRGGAAALQGLAFWTLGDLAAARQIYPTGIADLRRAGHLADATGCALALADVVTAQGQLHEAMSIYEQALQFATERGLPAIRGTADMRVGMSELYYEFNDLPAAAQCLQDAQAQGEQTGLPQSRYRLRAALARLRAAAGDLPGALALLDEAERLYMGDFSPYVRPLPAVKARIWAAQGRLDEAFNWAGARHLTPTDDLSYLREYEHITLARLYRAAYQRDREPARLREAAALLDRLLAAAEAGGRAGSVIEIQLLRALIRREQGDLPAALDPLRQALALAEREGSIRVFVDEGPPAAQLLGEAAAHAIQPAFTGRLLAALAADLPGPAAGAALQSAAPVQSEPLPAQPAQPGLVEPLSQRELDVLRLLRTELSGPEIAQTLMVGLSTVRSHTKSIFSKLNVNSRRAAVRRAAELKLL